jgi:hypothetical protein
MITVFIEVRAEFTRIFSEDIFRESNLLDKMLAYGCLLEKSILGSCRRTNGDDKKHSGSLPLR